MGDLMSAYPGSLHISEPLIPVARMTRLRQAEAKPRALPYLKRLLTCDFSDLLGMPFQAVKHWGVNWPRFHQHCDIMHWKEGQCRDPGFLTEVCQMFPIKVLKLDRASPSIFESMLLDKNIGSKLRLVILVRDPRGVMMVS